MLKVMSDGLWPAITSKAKSAALRKAAIAYFTDYELFPVRDGDLIVVDASDAAIAGGRTCAKALARCVEVGVSVFSLAELHAKVLVMDDVAVIGSANASRNSERHYFEAALWSDRPDVVGQVDALITQLSRMAKSVTPDFIERILGIVVERNSPRGHGKRRVVGTDKQRHWLVGLHQQSTYPGDFEEVEEQCRRLQDRIDLTAGVVDWFWWPGNARFATTAKVGDVVVQCIRPRRVMKQTRGVRVYRHARIVEVEHRQDANAKVFYVVESPGSDKTALTWKAFAKRAGQAGVVRRISIASTVEMTEKQSSALFELWPE